MDSNDTKQIIIGFNAIEDSCAAMLKPIRIDLNDTETAMNMTREEEGTLEVILECCEAIQTLIGTIESGIDDLKTSIFNDGDIDKSRDIISDILLDGPPVPKPFKPTNAVKLAENIFLRTG